MLGLIVYYQIFILAYIDLVQSLMQLTQYDHSFHMDRSISKNF